MNLRPVLAALLLTLSASAPAQQPAETPPRFDKAAVQAIRDKAEKMMAASLASAVQPSDTEFGFEVMETLSGLLRVDPERAVRFFLRARAQVAGDRQAGTASKPGEAAGHGSYRGRSVSVLGAALGAALQEVDKFTEAGDENLPKLIAAVAAILSSDEGSPVESSMSVDTHLGNLLVKAATPPRGEGKFTVQRLLEKLGPVLKPEWVPAVFGPGRGIMWGMNVKNDTEAQNWLEQQAKDGPHREVAMMFLAGARISNQEHDATNKQRANIMARDQLPAEQQWLISSLEQKTLPPVLAASFAAEILRVWPTAEPPLRYVCAHALAAAWTAGVPVNETEAGRIVESLTLLSTNGVLPSDEGMKAAMEALFTAATARLERSRGLYGWPAPDCLGTAGAELLRLASDAKRDDLAQKFLTLLRADAAKDDSLATLVRVSQHLQGARLHAYAGQMVESITDEQLKSEKVLFDLRKHIACKRVHVPIEAAAAAGGTDAALKATIAVLNAKTNEPSSWYGAAWAWHNMAAELRREGNVEESLRRYCIACILAHAADHFGGDSFGKYGPPAEGACRDQLNALKIDPRRVSVFRTTEGITAMLAEFGEGWKPLSALARRRILDGAEEE